MAKKDADNDSPFVPVEEQPYPVPENWRWVRIKSICTLQNGKAFKPADWSEIGIPIVRIQNLNDPDSQYNYFAGEIEEKYHLHGGELLFAWSGTPGTSFGAHIWKYEEAVLNQHIFKIDFSEQLLDKTFFMYALNQRLDTLISVAHGGAGLQHVTKAVFENTCIVLPPLSEQKCIVDHIESLFAKLDETKEMVNVSLKSFELRKSAILHKAFSGELTSAWRSNRNIDEPWVTTNLSQVVSEFKYGTSEKSTYDGSGMPVLRIPNIADGSITFEDVKYLSHTDIPEENQIHENDILIIRSNGSRELVGKSALVPSLPTSYAYASFLIRIRPLDNILPKYLVMYLNSSDARNQMFKKAKSSAGINNINSKELGSITIGLPPLSEQVEIVRILDNFFAREADTKGKLEATLESIETIKKAILAKAFEGDLDTNNPSDESAESLLRSL